MEKKRTHCNKTTNFKPLILISNRYATTNSIEILIGQCDLKIITLITFTTRGSFFVFYIK